jgi:uncharacterized protein YecE (DUF72 family)
VGPAAQSPETEALGSALPRNLYLGTSSWAFPGWEGIVYDRASSRTTLSRYGLIAYGKHPLLRAVGIDRTYYGPVPARELRAYAEQVPDGFRFLVKAYEILLRARLRGPSQSPNEHYLDPSYAVDEVVGPTVEGLGKKAAVLLFQFPPQNVARLGGPEKFAEDLHEFLRALPKDLTYAVELRNPELLTPRYLEALGDAGACHCYNAHPTMHRLADQVERCGGAAFPDVVVRWMLRRERGYDDARDAFYPFNRLVEADSTARSAIAGLCRQAVSAGKRAFVIVNNKAEGSAPLSVVRLAEELRGLAAARR